ncbi:unnamed protein product, partial [Mesorhabditis belari]|uniref:Uncharacterized protein n=1 Tax=Mesorhabditis belari TaxID=2138241 RepID=A0AAF3FLI1_9BILA
MPSLASLLDNGYLLITTSPDLFERQQVPALRCTVAPLSGGLTPEITKYEMEEEKEVPINKAHYVGNDQFVVRCYNETIADNSAVNLFPILTGRPIQMDPDNPDPEDTFVDLENVTFLWDLMKRRGCVTMMNDDIADVRRGLFHYPNHTFTGFPVSPTDFYLRPTHLFNTKHRISSGKTCLNDGTSLAAEYLSYMRHFSSAFKDACHFSFNFITSLTHDDPSMLGTIDQELKRALESLFAQDIEKSTTFVIMGDHGNRIHQIQRTTTGRVEERSPLFSIRLPDEWKRKNAKAHKNLRTNANRETDVYKKLFASLSERILSLPCVKSIRPHFRYPTLEVFSLNQMVLHGLRHENQWDSVKNYTSASDFEWIELGMIADMHKRYDGFELSFGLIARYRHRLSTDLYELSESPRVHERTAICNAPTVDEICEMCYYDNLVSARNEQQVI